MKYSCDVKVNRDNTFSMEKWKNVPTKYWPVYSWVWGTPIEKEEIACQLQEMAKNGIRVIYILPLPKNFRPAMMPTDLEPDYLTEEYFELYSFAVECAAKLGMQLYLYDEGGWPSGSACGRVLEINSHLKRMKIETVEKNSPYLPAENAIATYSGRKRVTPGEECTEPITEYILTPVVSLYSSHYPNVAEAETTDCFIELTHEAYKAHLGADVFGKHITMAFTDEPGVYDLAWTDNLADDFQKQYGYDARDYLPALVSKEFNTEEEKRVACDYYDFLSERLARNFFLKLRTWCRDNNIYSTGHLNGEDETLNCIRSGFKHALRQLRCLDVPGIDVIWRQIFPGKNNHFFPRLAASAASQIGSSMAITETFAVYGAGLTFDQMRYVTTYQMVRGINIINLMNSVYSLERCAVGGERPNFTSYMPNWEHLFAYNLYVARMCYLMNLGRAETDYAIYMPMRDMWAHGEEAKKAAAAFDHLAFYLEEKNCQFEMIDDDFLETAEIKDGRIITGDAAYKTIIVPECNRMIEHSKQVLLAFEANGGEVIYSNAPENVKPTAKVSGRKTAVRKKTLEDGKLYLIVNEDTEADVISVEFEEKGNIYLLDAKTGEIFTLDKVEEMCFASGEGKIFFITDKIYPAKSVKCAKCEIMTLTEFEAKRVSNFTIESSESSKSARFSKNNFNEEYTAIQLGDWCEKYGEAFSGKVSYRTRFTLDEVAPIKLELGEVKYSCEVIVNGERVGECIAKPFAIWIDERYLQRENELVINVANTAANQYVHTKVFDTWEKKEIGPYHATSLEFEKESIESGLFGPVRILV